MVGVLAVEERVEALAALGDELAGFDGLGVGAAAGAGAELGGVAGHRVEHRPRLGEAGGGVVEVEAAGGHRRV